MVVDHHLYLMVAAVLHSSAVVINVDKTGMTAVVV